MERSLKQALVAWKDHPSRMPLLVRGARQVGKSYLIEEFGRDHFNELVTVNLEFSPEYKRCFEELDPQQILNQLRLLTRAKLEAGRSLLFIDEIQMEPRAIMALRYFKEKMPSLHVIGAGSLLEFALQEEAFSFPVGRIQFMYMRPLSFVEFLAACGEKRACELLQELELKSPIDPLFHDYLLKLVRLYFLIGGMPAVVEAYRQRKDLAEVELLQGTILDTYRSDFGKYATRTQHRHLSMLFEQLPNTIAQPFKYAKVSQEVRSNDLKRALEQLSWAGLAIRVHATDGSGIPLRFCMKENKFKVLFLDIGLLQRSHQVDAKALLESSLLLISRGVLAEQFVGQELLAYAPPSEEKRLYFWQREARGSSAEVDYLVNVESKILPIEVKAGATGRLRSIKQFMEEKGIPLGVRLSEAPLSLEKGILSIPLYLIEQLPRLLESAARLPTH